MVRRGLSAIHRSQMRSGRDQRQRQRLADLRSGCSQMPNLLPEVRQDLPEARQDDQVQVQQLQVQRRQSQLHLRLLIELAPVMRQHDLERPGQQEVQCHLEVRLHQDERH